MAFLRNFILFVFILCLTSYGAYALDITKFEATCSDIGFKKNTEAFADCVIELVSRKKQAQSSVNTNKQNSIKQQIDADNGKNGELQNSKISAAGISKTTDYENESDEQEQQLKLLKLIHPDWEELAKSDEFTKWVKTLSIHEQEQLSTSRDGREIARYLTKFKKWKNNQQLSLNVVPNGKIVGMSQSKEQAQNKSNRTPDINISTPKTIQEPTSSIQEWSSSKNRTISLAQFKQRNPEFAAVEDKALADYLHQKYYSAVPIDEFYKVIGFEYSLKKNKLEPSNELFNFSIRFIFGFIIFSILTYGLYGKNRETAAEIGRWWGGLSVLFFLMTGGAKSDEYLSWGWFIATFIVSILSFFIGYLIGVFKWYFFTRKKMEFKEPPPFNESSEKHSSYQRTSQKKSNESASNKQSFDERLNELTNNSTKCLAILGLDEHASPNEIKAAFRKKSSEYHPDKVNQLGDRLKEVAEEEMKLLNKAYQILKKLDYC